MFIIDSIMTFTNWLWGWPLLALVIVVALLLSVEFKFFQFRYFGHAMKNTFGTIFSKNKEKGEGTISAFQAFCTALASTLGVGNIAGVSVAIAIGGPGAMFWMWAVALLGLLVKFSEICLGMAYREYDEDTKTWHGGFYWFVKKSLGNNWKWLGMVWAVLLAAAMVFAPAVQANSMLQAVKTSFDIPELPFGIFIAVLMAIVLVGGIKSLAKFAEAVVPIMSLVYIAVSVVILIIYGSAIPGAFMLIFKYAFTPVAASGGFAGATVMMTIRWGLARGIYSNNAGTGCDPIAHAAADSNHPVRQGLWGIADVFLDTIIVCTMTGLVVLCTGVWDSGSTSATLTAMAFGTAFGNQVAGTVFVSCIIFFFGFTSCVGNVYYGEVCAEIFGTHKIIIPYRLAGSAFAIVGSVGALSVLWNLFDFFFGLCFVCNLVVLVKLRKQIGVLINDYISRLKSGKWEVSNEETVKKIPELAPKD